jgi:hypothetical protein
MFIHNLANSRDPPARPLLHFASFSVGLRAHLVAFALGLRHVAGFGVRRPPTFAPDPGHLFVPTDLSSEDRVVRTDLVASSGQVRDPYVVALARQHRLTLAIFDKSLAGAHDAGGLVYLVSGTAELRRGT